MAKQKKKQEMKKKQKVKFKKNVVIKAEVISGKRYAVARYKGRFFDRRILSKDFRMLDAVKLFNKNKSLHEEIERTELTNFYEVVDERAKRPRHGLYRYVISATVRGMHIQAGSKQYDFSYPKMAAREEALYNFYHKLSELEGEYDPKVGQEIYAAENVEDRIEESVIYYRDL